MFEGKDRLRKEEWDAVVTSKKDAKAPAWEYVRQIRLKQGVKESSLSKCSKALQKVTKDNVYVCIFTAIIFQLQCA